MKPIVFFAYQNDVYEANLLTGTYWKVPGPLVEHRRFVLTSQGIPWTNWGSTPGQSNPVENVGAFGRLVP